MKDAVKLTNVGMLSVVGVWRVDSLERASVSLSRKVLRPVVLTVVSPVKFEPGYSRSYKSNAPAATSDCFTDRNRSNLKSDVHLVCTSINWLSKDATVKEICKYVGHDDDAPNLQEDQLKVLMDKFTLQELKQAYLVMLDKI